MSGVGGAQVASIGRAPRHGESELKENNFKIEKKAASFEHNIPLKWREMNK